jgi:hypothetical protein
LQPARPNVSRAVAPNNPSVRASEGFVIVVLTPGQP